MENITNKYSYLFEYPCLKQGEDKEIFTAIEKGIDVELNKERLFNAFFKTIYKEAAKIVKSGYHDDFEEALNHVTVFFYKGIDTYDMNKGACFYTHIRYWIQCATYKCDKLRKDPELVDLDLNFELEDNNSNNHYDCNTSAKQKKEILEYCESYCSGVNAIENIEKRDFLNQINNFIKNNKFLKNKDKVAFIEFYGLNNIDCPVGTTARALGEKYGVSSQAILNRMAKVERELKSHFISEKNFLFNA